MSPLRVPALPLCLFFCPLLRWSSLGSFLFPGPRPGRFGLSPSLSRPISLLCTRSTRQFGAWRLLSSKSEESEPPRTPLRTGALRRAPLFPSRPPAQRSVRLSRPRAPPPPSEGCSRACRFPGRPTGVSLLRLFTLEPFRVRLNFRREMFRKPHFVLGLQLVLASLQGSRIPRITRFLQS